MLRLRTFGGLSIANAAPIEGAAARRRPLVLLALLAVAGRRGLSRDKIIAMLWPESDVEHGRNSLSRLLSSLRSELGVEDIVLGTADLRLNPDVISSDVEAFEERLGAGDLEGAVAACEGDFLDGVFLKSAPDFERWVDEQRARLKGRQGEALLVLASRAGERGDHESAVRHWRRLAALEPLSAKSAQGLMNALAALGDRAAALQHYQLHRALLQQELGVEPEAGLAAFADQLRSSPPPSRESAPDDPGRTGTGPELKASERRSTARDLAGAESGTARGPSWRTALDRKAALVAAMILVAAVALKSLQAKPAASYDPRRVAVSVFANRTGDSALDALGVAAADWIIGGLSRLRTVDVVDGSTSILTYNAFKADGADPAVASDSSFAEATGAGVLVAGYFIRDADSLVFLSRVVDATAGRTIAVPPPIRTHAARPYSALEPLRQRVLGVVALHLDERVETVLSAQTSSPPTLAAYGEFVDGLSKFQIRDFAGSLRHFRSAYELDSSFFTALIWASWALGNSGRDAERLLVLEELERHSAKLSAVDRHGLRFQQAFRVRDLPRALEAVREATRLAPGSIWNHNLGFTLHQMGRPEEAAAAFALIPEGGWVRNWPGFWDRYTATLHVAGKHDQELKVAMAARRALPNDRSIVYLEARAFAATRKIRELDRVVAELRSLPDPDHRLGVELRRLAMELEERGESRNSRRLLDESIAWYRSLPSETAEDVTVRLDFVRALYNAERYREAVGILAPLSLERADDPEVIMHAGLLAARQGETAAAGEILRRLIAVPHPVDPNSNLHRAARIAAVLGNRDYAVSLLKAYKDRTSNTIPVHYEHRDLRSLRTYPPFIELTWTKEVWRTAAGSEGKRGG